MQLQQLQQVASGQLTVKPQNVVGKVGSSVSLACATDSGVVLKWDEYITNPAEAQTIVSGSNFIIPGTTKYGLLTTPAGNYQLTVNSLTLQNAGRYGCKYSTNSNIAASTEVIIFESDPICKNNVTNNEAVEGDYIKYSCEVTYKGKWAPVMEWKYNDAVVQANDESTGNTVKYTFVTELTPAHNGQNFACRTYFDQPKPENVQVKHADNKPITDNVHTDFTSQLTVYYGPRSLMVTPIKESYYPGDEVKVTADSNPSLTTYTWVNTATNQTLGTGHTIVIPADMLGSQLLTITVCSSIPIPPENTICKNNQLSVTVIPKQTTTTTTTTTPATTTATKTPVPPSGGSATTTIKPSDKPDESSGDSTCAIVGGVLGVLLCVTVGIVVFLVIRVRRLMAERDGTLRAMVALTVSSDVNRSTVTSSEPVQVATRDGTYQGLYATIPEAQQNGGEYEEVRLSHGTQRDTREVPYANTRQYENSQLA
ncbi:hypothetical protein LSAT2_018537 [Lamellibrachia satsuma]|nr:hypothetical protein LSAT2_018537 [Lamellibrachia satsuma]